MASIFINSETLLDAYVSDCKELYGDTTDMQLQQENHREVQCVTIDKSNQLEVSVHKRSDGSIILKGKNSSESIVQSSIIIRNCTTECLMEIVGEYVKISVGKTNANDTIHHTNSSTKFRYTGMIKEGCLNFSFPPMTYTMAVIRGRNK